MNWRTICHPDALNDWRANDEAAPAYDWQGLNTYRGEIHHDTTEHTLPKKQKAIDSLPVRLAKEAIEREIRRCRTLREEGET